jgi:cell division septation protein DedD
VAALSDPRRARSVTRDLSAAGYNAYIISPDDADPDAPYCVRVGGYPSKEAATDAAARLGRLRGEKLWVIAER